MRTQKYQIGQLGKVITGATPPTKHPELYGDAYPFITPTDITDETVTVQPERGLSELGYEKYRTKVVPAGAVCYTCIASIGKICIADRPSLTNQQINSIVVDEALCDYRFLYYLLRHKTPSIQAIASGAATPIINKSAFAAIEVDLPPLPAQKCIASFLWQYDQLIANNTRRIAILEEMAQAIYREWFVHFRFPGHEQVEMVESELGPIPAGWEISKISEVASVYRGRSYRSSELVEDGGLPFLNLKCIARDGGFRRDGLKRYNGKYKDTQVAGPDDMVMAVTDMTQERRIIARVARVPALDERRMVFSMDLVKIVPSAAIERHFLYGMLRYSGFAEKVKHYANGANVLHLSPQHVEDYAFLLPPSRLQQAYAACVSPLYELGDVLGNKNENLRKTRDLLLPKLISGEIDVEALEREPAEAIA